MGMTIHEAAYANKTDVLEQILNGNISPNLAYTEVSSMFARGSANLFWRAKKTMGFVAVMAPVAQLGLALYTGGASVFTLAVASHIAKNLAIRGGSKLAAGYVSYYGLNAWTAKNGYNKEGWTPLHFAAVSGATCAALMLIDHGANPDITAQGKTFINIAKELGHDDFIGSCEAKIRSNIARRQEYNVAQQARNAALEQLLAVTMERDEVLRQRNLQQEQVNRLTQRVGELEIEVNRLNNGLIIRNEVLSQALNDEIAATTIGNHSA